MVEAFLEGLTALEDFRPAFAAVVTAVDDTVLSVNVPSSLHCGQLTCFRLEVKLQLLQTYVEVDFAIVALYRNSNNSNQLYSAD
jgi:hypothetical protein